MTIPPSAAEILDRIYALLDTAQSYGLDTHGGEDAFALRETRGRYLPETLAAYEAIPPTLRGVSSGSQPSADDLLIEQLSILERACSQQVSRLAESSRSALSTNGRFLTERLGSLEALPEPIAPPAGGQPHAAQRFLEAIGREGGKPADRLEAIARRFLQAIPRLVEIERAGLFGRGPVRRLAITVPSGADRYRYALSGDPSGALEASCAKLVRGVAIRTETVPLETWIRTLFEDIEAFARTQEQGNDTIGALLR
ncbi:MAG: hypothetical protein ACYDGM_04540 [Vulcanimicrobiaceae bacterium]